MIIQRDDSLILIDKVLEMTHYMVKWDFMKNRLSIIIDNALLDDSFYFSMSLKSIIIIYIM